MHACGYYCVSVQSFYACSRAFRCPGRPSLDVCMESVQELRALNYSWAKIASMLRVSRSTLYRRLADWGIPADDYTSVTPTQLNDIIKTIKKDHPNDANEGAFVSERN